MQFDGDAVVRLLAALALGAILGIEREAADQPAGLRTHIAVCLGAALFGVISTLGFDEFFARRETTNVQVDVTRVASQVVVGIGFLGAGMIFRQGAVVKNLTTSASLWAAAAIGLAVGVGDIVTGAVATAILLASLVLLRPLRSWIRRRVAKDVADIRVELGDGVEPGDVIDAIHRLTGVTVHGMALEKDAGRYVLLAHLSGERDVDVISSMEPITRRDDVVSSGLEPSRES
ncbi:MAG: MgtC/SapB family protein [Acidimicrobiales bacterium]